MVAALINLALVMIRIGQVATPRPIFVGPSGANKNAGAHQFAGTVLR